VSLAFRVDEPEIPETAPRSPSGTGSRLCQNQFTHCASWKETTKWLLSFGKASARRAGRFRGNCVRERERERLVAAVRIGGARFIFIRLLNDHHLARHCAAHARMRRILACATQRVPISLSDIDSCSRSLTADRDSHAREIIPPFIEIMIPLDCRARRETGRLLRQALDR